MNVLNSKVPNLEGLLKVSYDTDEEGKQRFFLQSGRTLHLEGRLFGLYPLESALHSQSLSTKSGVAHGIAAVTAIENYLGVSPTQGGQKVRQVMLYLSTLHAHLDHFYFEVLPDYLNEKHFRGQGLMRAKFFPDLVMREETAGDFSVAEGKAILERLPKIQKTLAYLQQSLALLGGKFPVVMNLIPGGVTNVKISKSTVMQLVRNIEKVKPVVETFWPEDVKALIVASPDLLKAVGGEQQLISYGSLRIQNQKDDPAYYAPGVYLDGKLEPLNLAKITESFSDTYYRPADNQSLSNDLIFDLNKSGATTWIKASRYETEVMQTGPLARMLVTHFGGSNLQISDSISAWVEGLGLSIDNSNSGAARLMAAAFEGRFLMKSLYTSLFEFEFGQVLSLKQPFDFSGRGSGIGVVEAPGGSLLHQVHIEAGKITGYRIVSPSNWTLSSRDEFGKTGLAELEINQLFSSNPPDSILANRVVHSYFGSATDATQ